MKYFFQFFATKLQGLFIEGARWDRTAKCIDEALNGQLYDCMPVILLQPSKRSKVPEKCFYETPIYRTSTRRSVTTKSGHLNNFVTFFALNGQKQATHWLFRGVALLCQLDD